MTSTRPHYHPPPLTGHLCCTCPARHHSDHSSVSRRLRFCTPLEALSRSCPKKNHSCVILSVVEKRESSSPTRSTQLWDATRGNWPVGQGASSPASSARESSSSPTSLGTGTEICRERCSQSCPLRSKRPTLARWPMVPVRHARCCLSPPCPGPDVTAPSLVSPSNCDNSSILGATARTQARLLFVPAQGARQGNTSPWQKHVPARSWQRKIPSTCSLASRISWGHSRGAATISWRPTSAIQSLQQKLFSSLPNKPSGASTATTSSMVARTKAAMMSQSATLRGCGNLTSVGDARSGARWSFTVAAVQQVSGLAAD